MLPVTAKVNEKRQIDSISCALFQSWSSEEHSLSSPADDMGWERNEMVDHFRAQACLSGQMVSREAGSVCVSWAQAVPEILRIMSVCLVSVLY